MYLRKSILPLVLLLLCTIPAHSTRRALVFGLGKQEDVRWGKIHGDNDVYYVRQMLYKLGYTSIRTLTNEQATKQAMVDAFVDLALQCERGDQVYIHYSGHGQLMTDLDGDESLKWNNSHSAWDEAWIPYDAYMTYCPEDRGEKHFCDDEVARFLQVIRKKIGARGQLTVVVDACHSGDATAAPGDDEECVRGIDMKFSIPRDPKAPQVEETIAEEWLTISACKPYQLCTEMKEQQVGKLTYALYSMGAGLFQKEAVEIQKVLAAFMEKHKGRLPQTPMVTGKR